MLPEKAIEVDAIMTFKRHLYGYMDKKDLEDMAKCRKIGLAKMALWLARIGWAEGLFP